MIKNIFFVLLSWNIIPSRISKIFSRSFLSSVNFISLHYLLGINPHSVVILLQEGFFLFEQFCICKLLLPQASSLLSIICLLTILSKIPLCFTLFNPQILISLTEDTDRQALKDQTTVSLSEAADGLDVMGGHIGIVTNENDDKYLVWILKSIQKDSESETATVTIYVDVSDVDNTTIITKEFDRSKQDDKFNHDDNKRAKMMEKIQQKLSEPIGDADATRIAFVEKLQELKAALENGNSERVSELRDELKDLRSELGNIKSYLK